MLKVLTICVACLLPLAAVAQDAPTSYAIVGGEWNSSENCFGSTVGAATQITGDLWSFVRSNVGEYGSLEADIGYLFHPRGGMVIGLVAGPGTDWIAAAGDDPVAYVVSSSGFFAGFQGSNVGIYAGGKYTFALDSETYYVDGWEGGVWMTFGL